MFTEIFDFVKFIHESRENWHVFNFELLLSKDIECLSTYARFLLCRSGVSENFPSIDALIPFISLHLIFVVAIVIWDFPYQCVPQVGVCVCGCVCVCVCVWVCVCVCVDTNTIC